MFLCWLGYSLINLLFSLYLINDHIDNRVLIREEQFMMSVIEINYSSGKLFFLNIFHIYKYTIWFSNLLIFWIKESNMQRLIDEWAIGHGIYTCNNVVWFFFMIHLVWNLHWEGINENCVMIIDRMHYIFDYFLNTYHER